MTWLESGINSCISILSLQCKRGFYIKALFHMKNQHFLTALKNLHNLKKSLSWMRGKLNIEDCVTEFRWKQHQWISLRSQRTLSSDINLFSCADLVYLWDMILILEIFETVLFFVFIKIPLNVRGKKHENEFARSRTAKYRMGEM